MPHNAVDTTISDIRDFVNCRQLWDFKSLMRYGKVPKSTAVHLWFGDLFHQALEAYYTGEPDPATWFEQRAAEHLSTIEPDETPRYHKLLESIEIGPKLLRAYVRWASDNDNFEMVATEQRHTVRLNDVTPGHFFSFKFDGLVIDRRGRYWLKEFKTTSNLPNTFDWLEVDLQSVAYQWAAEQVLEYPIAGTIYTWIAKKNPRRPDVLKNGELSRAANMVTTYDEYVTAIEENGLNEDDYAETLGKILLAEGDMFFRRVTITASKRQREIAADQIRKLVAKMADPDVDIYHSPERGKCGFCDFREPCGLRLSGRNFERELELNYRDAEPRP